MVLAAGLGTRMRPLNDQIPKPLVEVGGKALIDYVLDRLADAGRRARRRQCPPPGRPDRAALAARKRPTIVISDERDELLGTGGGVVKALPQLGDAPFFHINSDTHLDRRREAQSARGSPPPSIRPAWTRCCCSRRRRPASAMTGRGDFSDGAGRPPARRGRARGGAVRLCRRGDPRRRRCSPDAPQGAFSLTHAVRPRRRGRAACSGCASTASGCMSARPTPSSAGRSARSSPARRETLQASADLRAGRCIDCAVYDSRMAPPRVFTIPASAPFLPTLIDALVDGRLVPGFPPARDPLALAGATLYLPTRRACRLARDRFPRRARAERRDPAAHRRRSATSTRTRSPSRRPRPARSPPTRSDLPQALGGLERRLLLAQLVLKWASGIAPRQARRGARWSPTTRPPRSRSPTTSRA